MRKSLSAVLLIAFALLICPAFAQAMIESESDGASATPTSVAASANAASPTNAGITTVICEGELLDWLYDHESIGGTVTLGGNITITGGYEAYFPFIFPSEGVSIVIDTGHFGLTFDGGCIVGDASDGGSLEFCGEGVFYPVVDVIDMGWFYMGNWNSYLSNQNITATGKDGAGGTALRISGADRRRMSLSSWLGGGRICSYGADAVGIELAADIDAYCFDVYVEGEGGIAFLAPNGGTLYYSRLTAAEGGGAASGAGLTLDTCICAPSPEGVTSVNRRITDVAGGRLYLPVRRNSEMDLSDLLLYLSPNFFLTGGAEEVLGVNWNENAFLAVDTGVLGKKPILGALDPYFQTLGLTGEYQIELIVDVRDPALPCVNELSFGEDERGKYASLSFWESCDPSDDNLILWRSDDNGATWYDFTDSPDMTWNKKLAFFYYGEITMPVMLQIEIKGAGESNVVTIYEKNGKPFGNPGGDRTGTDRGGVDTGDKEDTGGGSNPGSRDNPGSRGSPESESLHGSGSLPSNGGSPGNNTQNDASAANTKSTSPADQTATAFPPADNGPAGTERDATVKEVFAQPDRVEGNAPLLVEADLPGGAFPDSSQYAPLPSFNTGAAILVALFAAALFFAALLWIKLRLVRR